MKFRTSPRWPFLPHGYHFRSHRLSPRHLCPTTFARHFVASRASVRGGSEDTGGTSFFIPGATLATILMLGALHARRLYADKKIEEAKEKGIESEFSPDTKAAFMKVLPLRSISRLWGFITSMDIPVPVRPYIYKAWARAFHTNLEEIALPLEEYASLQDFFVRTLKEGSRPIDPNPCCLISPVDGMILRIGELRESGGMIEQVKGFSYPAISLLGENSFLPMAMKQDLIQEECEKPKILSNGSGRKSWWWISFASPKVQNPIQASPKKGIFYCVIYLRLGDYHRVHSPVDWKVFLRRHFAGHLLPLNERATQTIRNLHVENERVVLEGEWEGGYMALAAIGATNVGSIKLFIEPELKTNRPKKLFWHSHPPDERVYEPQGIGVPVRKADELAAFNLGSTVVLVFQAPKSPDEDSDFKFCINKGDRIRMGEAIGRWHSSQNGGS